MRREYCFECKGFDGRHQPGCPRDPEDEAPALDGDYDPPEEEFEEREYDYEAELDAKWAARERHLDAWRLKR